LKVCKLNRSGVQKGIFAAVAVTAIATASLATAATNKSSTSTSDDLTSRTAYHSAQDLSIAFERVADSIHRSVVSIKSVGRVKANPALQVIPFRRMPFGDMFGFGDLTPQNPHLNPPHRGFAQQGLGTGFILNEDGYLLTNYHVIKEADEVLVTLWDDSTHTASIIGTDPKTDLAVLQIEADDLIPAPLGDDSQLKVGHWVAAVGNPFGLSSTMTAGIVSAIGRSRVGLADYEDFIQTDAAINPGNSGGPLMNLNGEVVGINTAIFSKNGGHMGIGFAIPINMARTIADSLIEKGHVERGFLGVIIQNLDKNLAESFDYDSTKGALVSDVPADSPAAEAGLEPGDIIFALDGEPIDDIDELRLQVANTPPGTVVRVEFMRNGEQQERDVKIAELDPDPVAHATKGNSRSLGLTLETLTPRLSQQLGMTQNQQGALVTGVEPFGAAAQAGVRLNDVILEVNGEQVEDAADLESALKRADLAAGVRLTLLSGSTKRFVFLRAS